MKTYQTIALTIIVALITCFITIKWIVPYNVSDKESFSEAKETVFERVMRTRTLRCAYTPYPPLTIKDPNTAELSGFVYDILEEMGKRLSLKIEWVAEVSPAGMFEGFLANQYDAICVGYVRNPARSTRADFTDPLFFMSNSIYVRQDDNRFDKDYSILNNSNYSFTSIDGEISSFTILNDFPKAKVLSLPETVLSDTSIRLLNVSTRKSDATIIEDSAAVDALKANPNQLKALYPPIRIYPSTIIIPQDSYALKAMLDAAIANLLETGYIKSRILAYTDGYGYYLPSNPYALESLKQVSAK
jgi:ABC-type amino acid transport substrate-binding protein